MLTYAHTTLIKLSGSQATTTKEINNQSKHRKKRHENRKAMYCEEGFSGNRRVMGEDCRWRKWQVHYGCVHNHQTMKNRKPRYLIICNVTDTYLQEKKTLRTRSTLKGSMIFVLGCSLDVGKKYHNLQSTVINEGGLAELFRNTRKKKTWWTLIIQFCQRKYIFSSAAIICWNKCKNVK